MHGMQGLNNKKEQFQGLSKNYLPNLINTLLRLLKDFSNEKLVAMTITC
jgi:hypothetical protein